jgi:hypothetical protein
MENLMDAEGINLKKFPQIFIKKNSLNFHFIPTMTIIINPMLWPKVGFPLLMQMGPLQIL